jgi:2-phosphoglycerate kinase
MEPLSGGPSGPDVRDLAVGLHHVLWIGGGTGAGKTSVATALADRHGALTYHYEFHDARDHSERIDPARHPAMYAFSSMSMDERWVLRTPEEMAEETFRSSRERMAMAIEDLLARPAGVPLVAERPWFCPEFVEPLLTSTRQAIWRASRLSVETMNPYDKLGTGRLRCRARVNNSELHSLSTK